MSAVQFIHAERDISTELGVSHKALRVTRADELDRDSDWTMVAGEVRYSEAGKARLLSLLKISPVLPPPIAETVSGSPPVGLEKNSEAEPVGARKPGDIENLTCFKCYSPNRRILEAKTSSDELVLVRIKDNRNLRPGMIMKCRFAEGRMWELAQRLPRFRGKW